MGEFRADAERQSRADRKICVARKPKYLISEMRCAPRTWHRGALTGRDCRPPGESLYLRT